jgi:ABC-type Na+ efflux pump permease subunit
MPSFDIYTFVGVLIVGELAGWAIVAYLLSSALIPGKPVGPERRRNLQIGTAVFFLAVALASAVPAGPLAVLFGLAGLAYLMLAIFRKPKTPNP